MDFITPSMLNNVQADSVGFGSALAAARAFTYPGSATDKLKSLTDKDWLKASIITLLGFAVYQILVTRVVPTDNTTSMRMAVSDVLKFGTMLITVRLISGPTDFVSGRPMNADSWMEDSAFLLTGLVAYDFAVRHAFTWVASKTRGVVDIDSLSTNARVALDDTLKYGTMFVVARWLGGDSFDNPWLLTSGSFLAGLAFYNLVIAGML